MIVNVELQGLKDVIADMDAQPKAIRRIAAMALNRAAAHGKTKISQAVKRDFAIRAGDIKKEIDIPKGSRANQDNLFTEIIIEGKPIPLILFKTKGKGGGELLGSHALNKRGLRRIRMSDPVRVMVKRSGGYKPLKMAFIAQGQYGQDVFRRVGKARGPIKALRGPSIAGMVKDAVRMKEITDAIETKMNSEFRQGLVHAIGKGRVGSL